jgi:HSP20 family protein
MTKFHRNLTGTILVIHLKNKNNFILKIKTMLAIKNKNLPFSIITDIFDDLFDLPSCCDTSCCDPTAKTPVHDVIENDNEYIIEMLLAGVKKEDISIDIKKDKLIVKAERKEIKDLKYNRKQTYFGKYERLFILPDNADIDNIEASMDNGILKIIILKTKDIKLNKKAIEIK